MFSHNVLVRIIPVHLIEQKQLITPAKADRSYFNAKNRRSLTYYAGIHELITCACVGLTDGIREQAVTVSGRGRSDTDTVSGAESPMMLRPVSQRASCVPVPGGGEEGS